MISYHIVASVSLAQREDLVREAERRRIGREGRTARRCVLREARLPRLRVPPATPGGRAVLAHTVAGARARPSKARPALADLVGTQASHPWGASSGRARSTLEVRHALHVEPEREWRLGNEYRAHAGDLGSTPRRFDL